MNSEIFPLKPTDIKDAFQWMQAKAPSPDQSIQQMRRIEDDNKPFGRFIEDMSSLRRTFEDMAISQASYINGVLFILNALRKSYEDAGKPFQLPPYARMEGYLLDLIGIEDRHSEVDYIKEKGLSKYEVLDLSSGKEPTSMLFRELKDELVANSTLQGRRLRESFYLNSQEELTILEEGEPEIISATSSLLMRVYGKRDGVIHGALDVYKIFSAQEEINELNAMWAREVR